MDSPPLFSAPDALELVGCPASVLATCFLPVCWDTARRLRSGTGQVLGDGRPAAVPFVKVVGASFSVQQEAVQIQGEHSILSVL